MQILVDEKIVLVKEAFSRLGHVKSMSGSEINPEVLTGIDVLVTRTTTKVDRNLLHASKVKFVATATAGVDHIDLDYLTNHAIGFTSAAGCNAVAVAEYVINALVRLATAKSISLQNKTIGIIGAGNTGTALKQKAESLGFKCLQNDPPLFDKTKNSAYIGLTDLVEQSDIISLHVPLTRSGAYPTFHLIDETVFKHIRPGTVLLNTSRGGVIKESDLVRYRNRLAGLILDVWENEPSIDFNTLNLADIATPHIAGYSLDGKLKATEIVYQKTCDHFHVKPTWESPRLKKPSPVTISPENSEEARFLESVVRQTYDIYRDDNRLRQIVEQPSPANYFQLLRNQYEFRSEFSNFLVLLPPSTSNHTRQLLRDLGFMIS